MKTLSRLFLGEMRRMINYKILPVSLVTSVLWIILFLLLSGVESMSVAPMLLFTDIVMMSILLVGASYHLEKQEGTVKSMLVMPVGIVQIVFSKVMASLALSLESAIITCGALYFIHGITLNYGLLLLAVVFSGISHAVLGYSLSLFSRDFSSLLGYMSLYVLIFAVPVVLLYANVIPANLDWLLMISPAYSAQLQLTAAFSVAKNIGRLLFSYAYLALLTILLVRLQVAPGFKRHAVRG